MKAAVHTRYGPPDVVRIAEVEKPAAKDNEVLVRVHVTTVNRTDCGLRAAKPFIVRFFTGLSRPRVTVLGNEFAGEIEEAAPSTEGSHYALSLIRKAKIQRGQDVLVNGATGAIGSAAVQLLKRLGATVTAVCATEHLQLVKDLGADRVIDYLAEDFTEDEQSYHVVLDAVGKSSFGRCKRLLKPGGIYLSTDLGPLSQNPILALVTPLFGGKRVMFPIPKDEPEMVRYFKELIESGAFRPLIDRRYRLDEIVEAYRYVETGQKIGNVVICVEPSSS